MTARSADRTNKGIYRIRSVMRQIPAITGVYENFDTFAGGKWLYQPLHLR